MYPSRKALPYAKCLLYTILSLIKSIRIDVTNMVYAMTLSNIFSPCFKTVIKNS